MKTYSKNHVEVDGNLGRDPDVKYFESGSFVVNLRIAIYNGKSKDGEFNPSTWMDVKVWNFEAAANTRKGDKISIIGQLASDNWNDRDTNKPRQGVYVLCNASFNGHSFEVLKSGNGGSSYADDDDDAF